jgi:hypothetical protein
VALLLPMTLPLTVLCPPEWSELLLLLLLSLLLLSLLLLSLLLRCLEDQATGSSADAAPDSGAGGVTGSSTSPAAPAAALVVHAVMEV